MSVGLATWGQFRYSHVVEIIIGIVLVWIVYRLSTSYSRKTAGDLEKFRQLQRQMRELLEVRRNWNHNAWWHSDSLDLTKMIYCYNMGIDDQAWYTYYFAVRLGTRDWWLQEFRSSHFFCGSETAKPIQAYWFPAKNLLHEPQELLDTAYLECVEFFRRNPGMVPDTSGDQYRAHSASTYAWTPPAHADAIRVEQSWLAFQARTAELSKYESTAIDQGERCPDCVPSTPVREGTCSGCGRLLVRVCDCGFTNLPGEAFCKSCERPLAEATNSSRN